MSYRQSAIGNREWRQLGHLSCLIVGLGLKLLTRIAVLLAAGRYLGWW